MRPTKPEKFSERDHQIALEVIKEGQIRRLCDIAEKFDCGEQIVSAVIKRLNIQPRKRPSKHHRG